MGSRFASSSSQANAQPSTPMEQQVRTHAARLPIAFTHVGYVATQGMVRANADKGLTNARKVAKAKVAKAKVAEAKAKSELHRRA